ncbi:hypothetical protein LTR86_007698 [Recurvomyces mirabilis]|nr:hypothetical protein LTR86_007698 [Recurvomyces mirabilis]
MENTKQIKVLGGMAGSHPMASLGAISRTTHRSPSENAASGAAISSEDRLLGLPVELRDQIWASVSETRVVAIGCPVGDSSSKLRNTSGRLYKDYNDYLSLRSVYYASNIFSFEFDAGDHTVTGRQHGAITPVQVSMAKWIAWTKDIAGCTPKLQCLMISTPYFFCTYRLPEVTCKLRLKSWFIAEMNRMQMRQKAETAAFDYINTTLSELRGRPVKDVADLHHILQVTLETMVLLCPGRLRNLQDNEKITLGEIDVVQHAQSVLEGMEPASKAPCGCRCADLFGLINGGASVFTSIHELCNGKVLRIWVVRPFAVTSDYACT